MKARPRVLNVYFFFRFVIFGSLNKKTIWSVKSLDRHDLSYFHGNSNLNRFGVTSFFSSGLQFAFFKKTLTNPFIRPVIITRGARMR
jgi:hypothetical protein